MNHELQFIPKSEFDRVLASKLPKHAMLPLIAKMCRLNTLFEVKRAGSGHLGSSFSAMDIVVYLYYDYLNVRKLGIEHPNRDIYFSSKGHDVPGLYAVLYSLGIIPEEQFLKLRRLGGLDGHPDMKIPGVEANTGSLGMGISKGRGIAFAKKHLKREGKVIVMTGDGEFQEGQNFEALQTTVSQGIHNLIVVMDHNKLQSDRKVQQIVDLHDLEVKFRSFGWHVDRIDGHDYAQLEKAFTGFERILDKPKILICDTIKGRGISFMEHPEALKQGKGFYKWHAGAPDDESFMRGYEELLKSLKSDFSENGLNTLRLTECQPEEKPAAKVSKEFVSVEYGKALFDLAKRVPNFVVLDADLSADCKIRDFEDHYADRFVECGIAEQDMVSMAAGIAGQGLIPVVNSFANFLASRANEQAYNGLSEESKLIFACHYAGLIPAGPGKSHQSIRDISLFGAFPNCQILQAVNADEMRMIVDYAVTRSPESCMLRINIGPSPRVIELPANYELRFGRGVVLTEGTKNVLFAYGPVMMNEALVAQDVLRNKGVPLKVVNMPWLNRFDLAWVREVLAGCRDLFVLEDHSPVGGLADHLLDFMIQNKLPGVANVHKFAVEGYPACGTPAEVLKFHRLDGISISERILDELSRSDSRE